MSKIKRAGWYGFPVAIAALLAVALLFAGPADVAHATTISTASDVSVGLETNEATGSNVSTAAAALVLDEDAVGDIAIGTHVFNAPAGWKFDPASVPDAVITTPDAGGTFAFHATTPVLIAADGSTMSIVTIALSTTDDALKITIGGSTAIKVTPTTALTETGNITLATGGPAMAGITAGTSNFGTLTADYVTLSAATAAAGFDATGAKTISVAGSAVLNIFAGVGSGISGTFTTDAGSFPQTGSTTSLFVVDNGAVAAGGTNDLANTLTTIPDTGLIKIVFAAPSSGTAEIVFTPTSGTKTTLTVTTTGIVPASVDLSTDKTVVASAGSETATITVTVENSSGIAIEGETVIVTASRGKLTNGTGSLDQLRTYTTNGSGVVTVTFIGAGSAGPATLTFIADEVIQTLDITISGAAKNIIISVSDKYAGVDFAGRGLLIFATDLGGNPVAGAIVNLTFVEATLGDSVFASTSVTTVATCYPAFNLLGCVFASFTLDEDETLGGTVTVKGTLSTDSAVTGTGTVNIVGEVDSVTLVVTDVVAGGIATLTLTALDSEGRNAADDSTVTWSVTGGVTVDSDSTINDGAAETLWVVPAAGTEVVLTAVVTSEQTTSIFAVGIISLTVGVDEGTTTTTPTGDATAFEAPPAGGMTVNAAGTTDFQALIDAQTFTVESIWKLDVGTQVWQSYIPGGLAIANTLTSLAASDIVTLKSQ